MAKPTTLNQDFFKTWSPEMAYVLGYFAADGTMIHNKRGGHFIEFTTTDKTLLRGLERVTGASQRISVRPYHNAQWRTQYRIQIGSKAWFADLEQLGFTSGKSKTLRFPNVPGSYLGDFVRGYFDGDGCVYLRYLKFADRTAKRWVLLTLFTSGSRPFLEALWLAMKQHGVAGGTIQPKTRGFELKFSHRDSLALYRLIYDTRDTTGLRLPRKYRLFTKAMRILYPNAVVA